MSSVPEGRAANQPFLRDHLDPADWRAVAPEGRVEHLLDEVASEFAAGDLLRRGATRGLAGRRGGGGVEAIAEDFAEIAPRRAVAQGRSRCGRRSRPTAAQPGTVLVGGLRCRHGAESWRRRFPRPAKARLPSNKPSASREADRKFDHRALDLAATRRIIAADHGGCRWRRPRSTGAGCETGSRRRRAEVVVGRQPSRRQG